MRTQDNNYLSSTNNDESRHEFSDETNELMKTISSLKNQPISTLNYPNDLFANSLSVDEYLFDASAKVKILTSQVAMYLSSELRGKIFNQIDILHSAEDWDDEEDQVINQGSFKSFLSGLLLIDPEVGPGIGISYEGNLIAAWTSGKDRLTIEFLPNKHAKWVINQVIDGEEERAAGYINVARICDCLAPYQTEVWFRKSS